MRSSTAYWFTFLATMVACTGAIRNLPETCDHFEPQQVVVVDYGHYQGSDAIVVDFKGKEGKCFYKVRGSFGTGATFTQWYRPGELVIAKDY